MCLVFSVLALFLSRILLQEPKLTYIIELTIEDKEIKVTFTQFYIKRNKNDFPSSRLHGWKHLSWQIELKNFNKKENLFKEKQSIPEDNIQGICIECRRYY